MMNQMNENSMNNMGMNDKNSLNMKTTMIIDKDVQRLKEIVKPYENRIKELEEINRKNNFTIAILKNKLNQMNNQRQQIEEGPMTNNMNKYG